MLKFRKIVADTGKALLLEDKMGQQHWLPHSQIYKIKENKKSVLIKTSKWMIKEKKLEYLSTIHTPEKIDLASISEEILDELKD